MTAKRLSRKSGVPLYAQVSDFVREKIYEKEWGVDEPIPSEHELMDMLGLARGTVQKGVRVLVDEGLLVQQRGRGTFVTKPLMARPSTTRLLSFAESMDAQDIAYQTQVVAHRVEPARDVCAQQLGIASGADHLFLARVRSVRGRPAMYIESHLNLVACPGLDEADFSQESVFAAVERTSGHAVGRSEMVYSACVAGKVRGRWLECDEHAPVLNCDQLVRLDDDTPFEWGSVWLPANRCVISSETSRA
ncbi:MAG: GntR family transcriptional regulator [Coriobacteriales bacterium]|nr:GntR family transcriptional regulator [Coriobacteriales bacterium]